MRDLALTRRSRCSLLPLFVGLHEQEVERGQSGNYDDKEKKDAEGFEVLVSGSRSLPLRSLLD